MGITPAEIDRMSLWQYQAALWQHNRNAEVASDDPHAGVTAPSAPEYYAQLAELQAIDPRIV